ncbi:hypothetical protein PHYBOEH_007017 [Phytophthora boehmeriae]|uniref:Uncharacterized protein n=1 Tax=Phytophthora boehmeriae TaxID=109152 RepID=A0A8T1X3H4_9STRA|nr:hypothetical protein PHYBOEH_007017 [Phytophthora boehmeriae]
MTDLDQSMAELREFAQQLLKEEARISSLLAQTGSKSPCLNRMRFSDKLHKMIEIAESSMYERGLVVGSNHREAARSPLEQAQLSPNDRCVLGPMEPLELAEEKTAVSKQHDTPKTLSVGYKKARWSGPKNHSQNASNKHGITTAKVGTTALPDLKIRSSTVPFLEPLHIGPEKAPAKKDPELSDEQSVPTRKQFRMAPITLSETPQKDDEVKDILNEEAIQEDIPMYMQPQTFSNLKEEDEPVPEHIDKRQEEFGYMDLGTTTADVTLQDQEAAPIVEEIVIASPVKDGAEPGITIPERICHQSGVEDDTYQEELNLFEAEESMDFAVLPELSVGFSPTTCKLGGNQYDIVSKDDSRMDAAPWVYTSEETGENTNEGNQSLADNTVTAEKLECTEFPDIPASAGVADDKYPECQSKWKVEDIDKDICQLNAKTDQRLF